ncbi:hypothetical protein JRO89_XS03G0019200 [Xanthoceras sorbifolium]|uniref:FAR1 domain-containing protein n=1 Tax=Xanthoceras sorbifolium TaxID=99658 RepID=A0ABQ8I8R1_9ROSI|nr:hypothetical protein JRO89_XS03G0019200 [Xanthoceras sorbifolium]
MDETSERVEKIGETSGRAVQTNQEPHEGMVFESESAAKSFYDDYARRVGFQTRVLSSRKSERDGSIISRGLGCRGGSENRSKGHESCSAMILLKKEKLGTWVVRRFVRDHNHPLVPHSHISRRELDEKDIRIQELTAELRVKKRLSTVYREQLITFMKDVEDHNLHLSKKMQLVYDNLKKLEAEREELLHRK